MILILISNTKRKYTTFNGPATTIRSEGGWRRILKKSPMKKKNNKSKSFETLETFGNNEEEKKY